MIIEISKNISKNTTFSKGNSYVIIGEIHVLSGVTLRIDPNVAVYIRNGEYPSSVLKKSVLIFDTGSSLSAANAYFKACDSKNVPVGEADNGGIWFLGSSANVEKDGISVSFSTNQSNFVASKIFTYFLGSKDLVVREILEPSADQDAITILGCGSYEFYIQEIISYNSGDNGIDVIESYFNINNINVQNPGEDALNVQSSKINVSQRLTALVPLTSVYDRDIFDFEADNGVSSLRIAKGVKTNILGIFGDQLDLVSADLPQPTDKLYKYNATTKNGQSFVYAGFPKK